MRIHTNRNLAKGFMPVLLLSAALSLPAAGVAAPSPNGKAHAADKADKNHKQKARQHAQQAQKQAKKAEQHAQKAQRQAAKAQKNQKVVVVPQRVEQPRRVVVRQPVVVERPVYVAQRNNRNRARSWDGWNRRYNKYGSGGFQLDGTVMDQQHGCVLVRDHQGQVIPLVGNPGDLRRGEHVLFSGRIQNGTVCGTAFRVDSVERVWADGNHRRVLFDRRQDGEYYDRSGGRYSRDRYEDRYDDRYDDRYNRDGYDPDGRRAISIDGRLDDSGDCPVIRGDRGEYYDLVGDLSRFQDGRHVRVIGRDGIRSNCGGKAIEVGEIIYR